MFKRILAGRNPDPMLLYAYLMYRNGMLVDARPTEAENRYEPFSLSEALTVQNGWILDFLTETRTHLATAIAVDWRVDTKRLTSLGPLDLFLVLHRAEALGESRGWEMPLNTPTPRWPRLRGDEVEQCLRSAPSTDLSPEQRHEMRRKLLLEVIEHRRGNLAVEYSVGVRENARSLAVAFSVRSLTEHWTQVDSDAFAEKWLFPSPSRSESDLLQLVQSFSADWMTWEAKGECGDARCSQCGPTTPRRPQ